MTKNLHMQKFQKNIGYQFDQEFGSICCAASFTRTYSADCKSNHLRAISSMSP